MIKGVEVLNQVDVFKEPSVLFRALATVLIFITLALFVLCVIWNKKGHGYMNIIFAVIAIILSLISYVCIVKIKQISEQPSGTIEYQVTIDDTVSMNDFNEKYEIIKVEGKIYTIREKEEKQ